ncbi:MAG: DUF5691 domain-containing protein [Pirellulaceae bacterium]
MEELTKLALVGTGKQTASLGVDVQHPAESLLVEVASDDREHLVLLRAAARGVYERCGHTGERDIAALTPCPRESRRVASGRLLGLLQNALATKSDDLLKEFLRQMAASELLLPPELLPEALEVADVDLREMLLPLLGERGRWLSQFNTEWQWVSAGVAQLSSTNRDGLKQRWDEGAFSERRQVLLSVRRGDPALGREWLAETLDGEKAEHRARLLQVLLEALSPADEPLLESRLDDRSEQVRAVAADLLARLPDSALAARMRQRATEMFMVETAGTLGELKKLVCNPPEAIDKSWQRDAVPLKPPPGRGKRAVWLESVISRVPPSEWTRRFAAEPRQLIEAIADDDFWLPTLSGWTAATVLFAPGDAESARWLGPLWSAWQVVDARQRGKQRTTDHHQQLRALLSAMNREQAEACVRPLLGEMATDTGVESLAFLSLLPKPWSETLASDYLRQAREVLARHSDNRAFQWASSLQTAARCIPPSVIPLALEEWHVADSRNWHNQAAEREVERFMEALRMRQTFYDELQVEFS